MKIKLYLGILVLLLSSVKLTAQLKVVPFCPSKNIVVYTAKMEKKYHLFSEYKGFVSGELHQQSDSVYLIEIIYKNQGKYYMIEESITDSILEDFRSKIKNGNVYVSSDNSYNDINARLRFNLGGAVYSFSGYSWMVPLALHIKNPKVFIGVGLVSSSIGFFIPMVLTKNVTPSETVLKNYGQFKGFGDGLFVYSLFDKKFENTNKTFLYSISFSILEGTAGYFIGRIGKFSYLNALTTRTYSFYGYYLGGTFGFLFNDNLSGISVPMLISNLAGAAGGYYISKNFDFTRGDNRIVFGTSLLAASWATSFSSINDFNNNNVVKTSYAIGSTIGIGIGTFLGIKQNLTASQSVIVNLSSVGTGLIFGGIAGIAYGNIPAGFFVGSAAGTGTFIWLYRKYALKNKAEQVSLNHKFDNFSFSVNPSAYFMKQNKFMNRTIVNNDYLFYNPLFSVTYKF